MRSASQALLIAIVVTLGMTATVAYGAVSDEQVQQLIDRIEEQDRRIAELEKGVKTSTEQSQSL
ncbi:MAG: hypothetical protein R3F24_07220 [Gammaproteobacteria bacterium]